MAATGGAFWRCCTQEDVLADFGSLVGSSDGSDVEFLLDEGLPIPAHRAILAARCGHFKQLFFGSGAMMAEGNTRSVRIPSCPRRAFLALLDLLYTGVTHVVDPAVLVETYSLLDCYNMTELAELVRQRAILLAEGEAILSAAEAAHQNGCPILVKELVTKMLSSKSGNNMERVAIESASRDVLVEIARQAIHVGKKENVVPISILKKKGNIIVVSCSRNGKRKRDGAEKDHVDQSIKSQRIGYNYAMLSVPTAERFCLKGEFSGTNQVSFWLVPFKTNVDKIPDNKDGFRLKVPRFTEISLTFCSHPVPTARLHCNGVEKESREFVGADFRPLIGLGDEDELRNVVIE